MKELLELQDSYNAKWDFTLAQSQLTWRHLKKADLYYKNTMNTALEHFRGFYPSWGIKKAFELALEKSLSFLKQLEAKHIKTW